MKTATEQAAAPQNPASGNEKPATQPRHPRRMARDSGESGPVEKPEPMPRATSKIELVLALLRRSEGATLEDIIHATSWLPHTICATLTGLRKKGHLLIKDKRGDVTCYRIGEAGA